MRQNHTLFQPCVDPDLVLAACLTPLSSDLGLAACLTPLSSDLGLAACLTPLSSDLVLAACLTPLSPDLELTACLTPLSSGLGDLRSTLAKYVYLINYKHIPAEDTLFFFASHLNFSLENHNCIGRR